MSEPLNPCKEKQIIDGWWFLRDPGGEWRIVREATAEEIAAEAAQKEKAS